MTPPYVRNHSGVNALLHEQIDAQPNQHVNTLMCSRMCIALIVKLKIYILHVFGHVI